MVRPSIRIPSRTLRPGARRSRPPCDVIVAGYWDQILAARALGIAPVVHFEQGDFHLFEEVEPGTLALVRKSLEAADATMTVSGTVAEVLRTRYGVEARVVHNAV